MAIRDPAAAEELARRLVRNIARGRAKELAKLRSSVDVTVVMAKSIAKARRRFEGQVPATLHDGGMFDAAVQEELVGPVADRLARRIAEDGASYRETPELHAEPAKTAPKKKPRDKKKPKTPRDPMEPAYRDLRKSGMGLMAIGILSAIGMATLAIGMARKDRISQRAQTMYVDGECTLLESRDVPGEGGMQEHEVKFVREQDGHRWESTRYNPQVDEGPGASWLPKPGSTIACVYDPEDPSMLFLSRGQAKKTDDSGGMSYIYMIVFPLVFIGMGAWMRWAPKSIAEGD